MKKGNVILALILAVLLIAIAYFLFGTNMRAEVAASRDGERLVCDITLTNGSLFPYEYLEFLASNPSALTGTQGAGESVPMLSDRTVQAAFDLPEGESVTLKIGYYVLGMRKTVTIQVP